MIYTLEKAQLISNQLKRFTTSYEHHLAGQFANIDFWMGEVTAALKTLDEHRKRFENMSKAQQDWVTTNNTRHFEYCPICGGRCEFGNGIPHPPKRRYKTEITEMRRELIDATYFFLVRCYREGLLNDQTMKERCDSIGTSIDPDDLN